MKALYDAVNDLPSDDPLRAARRKAVAAGQLPADSAANAKEPSQTAGTTRKCRSQSHAATPQTTRAERYADRHCCRRQDRCGFRRCWACRCAR